MESFSYIYLDTDIFKSTEVINLLINYLLLLFDELLFGNYCANS